LTEMQSRTSGWTDNLTRSMHVEELVDILLGVEWLADNVLFNIRELESDYLSALGGGLMTVEIDFVIHSDFLLRVLDFARKFR